MYIAFVWLYVSWFRCLNAHNKDWLKELAKEIPEANGKYKTYITIPTKQP
jgi:hypothetical protein